MRAQTSLELGIVSDEISNEFAEAMRHALSWGISLMEVRLLKSGRVPNVSKEDIDEVLQYVRKGDVRITALSPGIFKHRVSKTDQLEEELNIALPRTIDLAKTMGASLLIVFGFERELGELETNRNIAIDFLRRAAAIAERSGIRLAIENEPGFWCDTRKNTRAIIDDVASPALGANWDPANAYGTTEIPYPEGYVAIKEKIFNVHVKDTKEGSLVRCVPVGEGVLDWAGQLSALRRDNIVSHVTIETHCLPLVEQSRRNVETLRQMLSEISPNE